MLVTGAVHGARLREAASIRCDVGAICGAVLADRPRPPWWTRARYAVANFLSVGSGIERAWRVRGEGARALRRLLAAGHVAIIDDVITTGSTVAELKCVLLAAGVRQVEVWAVART